MAVTAFYAALSQKNYATAYALLGPSLQATTTLAGLAARFSTATVQATVTPTADPGIVEVELTVTQTVGTAAVTQQFFGTWYLVQTLDGKGWLLDVATFQQISTPQPTPTP